MIAALASSMAVLATGALALWVSSYYAPARHAGGGDGALTVAYLVARVEAETSGGGGRHWLREQRAVHMCGDLADALAAEETRFLPVVESGLPVDDRDALARHPGLLRRILAKLDARHMPQPDPRAPGPD